VVEERLGDEQPGRVDQQGRVGVLGGQLLADPLHLIPVGQVGGNAPGRALLGQVLDGVVDLVGVVADDDGAAAGGHDVGGGLAAHPAAAADHYELLPGEDRHGHRPVGLLHLHLRAHALEPVHAHANVPFGRVLAHGPASAPRLRRTSSDRSSVTTRW
jgi:hypothetical protein